MPYNHKSFHSKGKNSHTFKESYVIKQNNTLKQEYHNDFKSTKQTVLHQVILTEPAFSFTFKHTFNSQGIKMLPVIYHTMGWGYSQQMK